MSVTETFIDAGFASLDEASSKSDFLDAWYTTLIFHGSDSQACAILSAMQRSVRFATLTQQAEAKFADHTIGEHMRQQVRDQYSSHRSGQQKAYHQRQRDLRRTRASQRNRSAS